MNGVSSRRRLRSPQDDARHETTAAPASVPGTVAIAQELAHASRNTLLKGFARIGAGLNRDERSLDLVQLAADAELVALARAIAPNLARTPRVVPRRGAYAREFSVLQTAELTAMADVVIEMVALDKIR